ncbi:uncharacterized protein LOC126738779 [Anthonomus grandis grandis]|uniref:uncharacterized protein LOC126738779 n=1 Tax=Anthonomus grandis grandis TaxID=2921223 RepID=UPI002165705B|nr:uncharacterized protein LOC126738779 [Anthonomus grandis grandis]
MVHALPSVLVFLCLVAGGFATRACYQCNSYTDRDHTACVDPMSPYPYVNYTFCPDTYLCTRVSYITQKQYVVSRGCDPAGNTCNNIYQTLYAYYPDISSFNCYTCSANYCNGASGLKYTTEEMEVSENDIRQPANLKRSVERIQVPVLTVNDEEE